MVKIIDRRKHALGTQAWNRSESSIRNIAWHYTAVARRNRSFITNHERYWKNTLGWSRGGYHFYIDADGKIYQNYNLTTQTNGVKYHNRNTVHISVEANSVGDYSQAQINARQELTLWLMARLNLSSSAVKGHKEFSRQSTSCPGYSVGQMNAFRRQLANGKPGKVVTSTSGAEKAPSVKPTGQKLHLPSSVDSWNIYKPGGPYTSGSQIAQLRPSKFGGLSYDIVGNPVKDVYLINTSQFGTAAIYASKSTSAVITGSGAGNAAPSKSPEVGKKLKLPATADTWKVYNSSGPYTSGNEIHKLTPSAFGGIEYEIKGSPAPNVYLIDTGVAGRVAIYAGPETSAKIVDLVKSGWIKNSTGWWYKEKDGSYPKDTWKKIGGNWYLFNNRGYMLTGWQKISDTWYYMNESGHMQTGWVKLNGLWYYLNSSGELQVGWFRTTTDGPWFYSDSGGRMQTGWIKLQERWFYLHDNGHMATGLLNIGNRYYYLQRNGVLITDDVIEVEANKHGHLNFK